MKESGPSSGGVTPDHLARIKRLTERGSALANPGDKTPEPSGNLTADDLAVLSSLRQRAQETRQRSTANPRSVLAAPAATSSAVVSEPSTDELFEQTRRGTQAGIDAIAARHITPPTEPDQPDAGPSIADKPISPAPSTPDSTALEKPEDSSDPTLPQRVVSFAREGAIRWAQNLNPRGKEIFWWAGVGTGAALSVGLAPLGPASGWTKAGINAAVAYGLYLGVRTAFAKSENQALSKISSAELGLEDITNTTIRRMIAGTDVKEKKLQEILGKKNTWELKVRNYLLGVSAGGTYTSLGRAAWEIGGKDIAKSLYQSLTSPRAPSVETTATVAATRTATITPTPTASETVVPTRTAIPRITSTIDTHQTTAPVVVPSAVDTHTPTVTPSETPTSTVTPTLTETAKTTATSTVTKTATKVANTTYANAVPLNDINAAGEKLIDKKGGDTSLSFSSYLTTNTDTPTPTEIPTHAEATALPEYRQGIVFPDEIIAAGNKVTIGPGVDPRKTISEYLTYVLKRPPTSDEYYEARRVILEKSGFKDIAGPGTPVAIEPYTVLDFSTVNKYTDSITNPIGSPTETLTATPTATFIETTTETPTPTQTPTVTVTQTPTETPIDTPVDTPVAATAPIAGLPVQPDPDLDDVKVELDNSFSNPYKPPGPPADLDQPLPTITEADKLKATNKILLQTAPAAVHDHLDLTKKAVDDFLTSKNIETSQLSEGDYENIRSEVQHELEAEANESFKKVITTEDISKFSVDNETTGDLLSKGKAAFNEDLATDEYQKRLLDRANKTYFQLQTIHQGAPAAVGRHIHQVDSFITADERFWNGYHQPIQADYHTTIESAARHALEKQANEDFIQASSAPTDNVGSAVTKGNELFESHFTDGGMNADLTGKVKAAISSAHDEWLTRNIPIHDHLRDAVNNELKEGFTTVPIDRDYGTVLFNHNKINDWGPSSAEVLGAEIAVNWDDLTSYWLETHPNGEYFPVSLSELDKLIEAAQNGDTASLNKLKEALHYVKAGSKIKLLNQNGMKTVLNMIRKGK